VPANAEMTGLGGRITIRDAWHLAETFEDAAADLIVTNPPFGVRMALRRAHGQQHGLPPLLPARPRVQAERVQAEDISSSTARTVRLP
jgi:23S rRNA G2445 N2-methylase RlmL